MAQGNTIIDLTGGTAGQNIIDSVWDPATDLLTFTRKDGTTFDIDLSSLSIDLQVAGAVVEPNGDIKLTVIDPNPPAGGSPTIDVIIPLSHKANITYVDAQDQMVDDKNEDRVPFVGTGTNTSGYKVLSEEDFTTLLMQKLTALADDMVEDVVYKETTVGGVVVSEDIIVSYSGIGNKPDVVISKLFDKVDKVPGMGLSEEDFTTVLKTKLDTLDVTGVKDITFNTATKVVSILAYDGSVRAAFTLPAQIKSDWAVANVNNDAFILNKNLVMDPIATNAQDIATNKTAIAANTSMTTALDVRVTKNTADILVANQGIANNDTDIASLRTDVTGVQADIVGVQTNLTAAEVRISVNEADIANLQQDNATEDGRLQALETSMAANDALDVTQSTSIASNTGRIVVLETDVATHTSEINNLNTQQATNTTGIATNLTDIATVNNTLTVHRTDIDTNSADIAALTLANGMNPAQIKVAYESNVNTNEFDDAEQLKVANMPSDQNSINTTVNSHLVNIDSQLTGLTPVDNLTSVSTTQPLTANMGRQLEVQKADKNSPTFTGNPTAPTPAVGDSDTSLATTAFVATAIASMPAASFNVIDDLISTSKTDGLSANQGRILNAEIIVNTSAIAFIKNLGLQNQAAIAKETTDRTAADAAAKTLADTDYVNVTGDTMTGQLIIPKATAANHAVRADAYASATLGGTLKARLDAGSSTLFLTNNGTNP